ncbi:prepilin-type N-terminal cleavage/methylation domain-containing protein [Aquabacterium sp. A7-Y]|uniref:type IV pilin protein n=1 Tax=Aquabacterium sp. A7-Y TaxID=1349605 RepID=UPI00223D3705|nr:type IV pilin protein [Aquabacterium sp. A7-Y]MCW7539173.1 prepilin-type N-terminal cleavage/methylation domain-containing protein [Aquabacterium sp. A7-Y]
MSSSGITSRRHPALGFTLIELMITVAVVAILSAIAYPSYTEYIAKGRRAQARTQLLAAQQWMERFYSENYRYDENSAGTDVADLLADQPFSTAPAAGEGSAAYNIALSDVDETTYTLRATRTGGAHNDKCGDFQLEGTGRKSVANYDSTRYATAEAAAEACWR